MSTVQDPVFQSIVVRSSTPPAAEKVNYWFQGMSDSPPTRPPSSHNSEFDLPAMDPSQWKAPTMEEHDRLGFSPAPEQIAPSPAHAAPPFKSPAGVLYTIPASPARTHATARLNEELNEAGGSVLDYAAIANDDPFRQPSRQPSRMGSVNGDAAANVLKSPSQAKSPRDRHLSYESWGNLDPPRESTFGPMLIKPGETHVPGQTPAVAAGIPLPSHQSDWGITSPRSAAMKSPAPPSVVGITIEAPSEARQTESGATGEPQNPEGSIAGSQAGEKTASRAPVEIARTARGPSLIGSPQPSNRDRTFSPGRSERSKGTSIFMTPAAFALPTSSATNYDVGSRAPTTFGGTPARVPLPMDAGTVYDGFSPRSVPDPLSPGMKSNMNLSPGRKSRAADELSLAPSARSKAQTAALEQRSLKATTEASVDSMATERSAVRSNKPSSYLPSEAGGPKSQYSAMPARESVALHPLTPQARSQISQNYAPPSVTEDLSPEDRLHAAVRGRSVASGSHQYQPSVHSYVHSPRPGLEKMATPHTRTGSPDLNDEERRLVDEALMRTPRTSYTAAPSALADEVQRSHFHDNELCLLLHAADDPNSHEVVRRAMRKAIKNRLKKLGLKYDNEAVNKYRDTHSEFHARVRPASPQPVVVQEQTDDVAPAWARGMMEALQSTQKRIEKIDSKLSARGINKGQPDTPYTTASHLNEDGKHGKDPDLTPSTVKKPLPNGGEHMYPGAAYTEIDTIPAETVDESERDPTECGGDDAETEHGGRNHHLIRSQYTPPHQDSEALSLTDQPQDDHSPGRQYFEEELYKLRAKPTKSERSHNTWEVTREGQGANEPAIMEHTETEIPEIPDSEHGGQNRTVVEAPLEQNGRSWDQQWHPDSDSPPPWQRIHQTLLNWAIVWPMSELDQALNSTLRGHQVNEVALSIWVTQTYKRYVRTRMMDHPRQTVDRLFVPPNIADAINNAVFNGRHGDAAGMLRDMWNPYGLEGMPRLLVVLARHRKDQNHWVVHRFSLPDGGLTTYDSFPERALPDGRPLGWWFAIRIAWPHALYPSPDHLVQKIVRLHRPMQLLVDNSVAAAGVWRNILMGSRAERSIDLERLRDLVNTEVRNLRQRKEMGKLSISAPKPNWEEIVGA